MSDIISAGWSCGAGLQSGLPGRARQARDVAFVTIDNGEPLSDNLGKVEEGRR